MKTIKIYKVINSIYTGMNLTNYINAISSKHIGFLLPSLKVSGGIYVIMKHANILKDEKWDVDLIVPNSNIEFLEFQEHKFNVISLANKELNLQYDILVATLYSKPNMLLYVRIFILMEILGKNIFKRLYYK